MIKLVNKILTKETIMQLKLSTDYAIRIVLYLSLRKKSTSLEELSNVLDITQDYTLKFCQKLSSAGILNIHQDKSTSISLCKNINEITMFDIVITMEPTIKVNFCLEETNCPRCSSINTCPVRPFYCDLQNKLEDFLKEITIESILFKS